LGSAAPDDSFVACHCLPPLRRSRLFVAAQLVFIAAVLWFAFVQLARQWDAVRASAGAVHPEWWRVAASAVLVLASYALLVETWRSTLRAWSSSLSFFEAARISVISNLGKYLPGKVWQIAAMGVMAKERGVSPVAATSSSLLVNAASILSGFTIVLLTGARVLDLSGAPGRAIAIGLVVLAGVGLASLPLLVPRLAALASRVTGRTLAVPTVPMRAVVVATVGTAVAWVLYGIAFRWFARGVLGDVGGGLAPWIAVYAVSYLVGYLAVFAPGGIVVREAMLVASLGALGLVATADAVVLAVASRLWLTVLEVLPGLLFLARDALRRRTRNTFA